MAKLHKRETLAARSAQLKNRLVFGAGGLALIVVLVVVAYFSRSPESGGRSPELGEHLHSLLAYGPGEGVLVGTHGATALSTDGGKTFARIGGLDGVDAMESGADRTGNLIVVAGHEGAKVSRDGGRSWSVVTGLPGSDIHGFGLDPANPKRWIARRRQRCLRNDRCGRYLATARCTAEGTDGQRAGAGKTNHDSDDAERLASIYRRWRFLECRRPKYRWNGTR